jgi:hypothetical protein
MTTVIDLKGSHVVGYVPDNSEYTILHVDLQRLLGRMLDVINMSLPNKQQHQAATHAVHEAFDETYIKALRTTYPDVNFSTADGGHALTAVR